MAMTEPMRIRLDGRLEPGGLNVERVRALPSGDRCHNPSEFLLLMCCRSRYPGALEGLGAAAGPGDQTVLLDRTRGEDFSGRGNDCPYGHIGCRCSTCQVRKAIPALALAGIVS